MKQIENEIRQTIESTRLDTLYMHGKDSYIFSLVMPIVKYNGKINFRKYADEYIYSLAEYLAVPMDQKSDYLALQDTESGRFLLSDLSNISNFHFRTYIVLSHSIIYMCIALNYNNITFNDLVKLNDLIAFNSISPLDAQLILATLKDQCSEFFNYLLQKI